MDKVTIDEFLFRVDRLEIGKQEQAERIILKRLRELDNVTTQATLDNFQIEVDKLGKTSIMTHYRPINGKAISFILIDGVVLNSEVELNNKEANSLKEKYTSKYKGR